AGAQLLPHHAFDVLVARVLGNAQRLRRRLAQRVRILAVDAEQAAFDVNSETAAERLGDIAGLSRRQVDDVAIRNVYRMAIALQGEGFAAGTESGHCYGHWADGAICQG